MNYIFPVISFVFFLFLLAVIFTLFSLFYLPNSNILLFSILFLLSLTKIFYPNSCLSTYLHLLSNKAKIEHIFNFSSWIKVKLIWNFVLRITFLLVTSFRFLMFQHLVWPQSAVTLSFMKLKWLFSLLPFNSFSLSSSFWSFTKKRNVDVDLCLFTLSISICLLILSICCCMLYNFSVRALNILIIVFWDSLLDHPQTHVISACGSDVYFAFSMYICVHMCLCMWCVCVCVHVGLPFSHALWTFCSKLDMVYCMMEMEV